MLRTLRCFCVYNAGHDVSYMANSQTPSLIFMLTGHGHVSYCNITDIGFGSELIGGKGTRTQCLKVNFFQHISSTFP